MQKPPKLVEKLHFGTILLNLAFITVTRFGDSSINELAFVLGSLVLMGLYEAAIAIPPPQKKRSQDHVQGRVEIPWNVRNPDLTVVCFVARSDFALIGI